MQFPALCPEAPVADLPPALAYYRDKLGFSIDWADEALGLAGLSRGAARMFMSDAAYNAPIGGRGPIVMWINLSSRAEIDALHQEWTAAGAKIEAAPSAKTYRLYEFRAQDLDQNTLRVFYDFSWEEKS